MVLGISEKKPGLCMPATHCFCGRPVQTPSPAEELQTAIDITRELGMQPATEAEIQELREIIFA